MTNAEALERGEVIRQDLEKYFKTRCLSLYACTHCRLAAIHRCRTPSMCFYTFLQMDCGIPLDLRASAAPPPDADPNPL